MKKSATSLELREGASPKAIGLAIVLAGIGVAIGHLKIGLAVAALGVVEILLVSRERWLFDRTNGTATRVRETGWSKAVLGRWRLDEFSSLVSRHVVTEYSDSESHRYDVALVFRSGEERPVVSFGSPEKGRAVADFLGLPLREIGPIDGDAAIVPVVSSAAGALWREKGLRGWVEPRQAIAFLERYLGDHPDDPAAIELRGAFLAVSGDRVGAVSDLLRAADRLRALGETDGAQRAERAARRLTDLPIR